MICLPFYPQVINTTRPKEYTLYWVSDVLSQILCHLILTIILCFLLIYAETEGREDK